MYIKNYYDFLESKGEALTRRAYDSGIFFENQNMHVEFDPNLKNFELAVYAEEPFSVIATETSDNVGYLVELAKFITERVLEITDSSVKNIILKNLKQDFEEANRQ